MKTAFTLLIVAVLAFSVSSCGRRDKLTPPEGSTYPQQYPKR